MEIQSRIFMYPNKDYIKMKNIIILIMLSMFASCDMYYAEKALDLCIKGCKAKGRLVKEMKFDGSMKKSRFPSKLTKYKNDAKLMV